MQGQVSHLLLDFSQVSAQPQTVVIHCIQLSPKSTNLQAQPAVQEQRSGRCRAWGATRQHEMSLQVRSTSRYGQHAGFGVHCSLHIRNIGVSNMLQLGLGEPCCPHLEQGLQC